MKEYTPPCIECVSETRDDIISTSITVELPWLPLDDEKEL